VRFRTLARIPTPVITAAAVLSVVLVASGVWWWRDLSRDLPGDAAIRHIGDTAQSTLIFDSSDAPASTLSTEERIDVPLAQVSPDFIRALIAVEDQRFYSHGAIDPPRIAAAALANVSRRRAAQGASTLTQQLARASFLKPQKTLRRKLQEVILASRIEHEYSKAQILELYVNRVYFGGGLWGVEAASLGYFGKHASQLTLAEGAMLAGLVQSPSAYAPTTDPAKAIRRRGTVLQAMLDSNAIDRATFNAASHEPLRLADALSRRQQHGAYFFEEIRKTLVDRYGSDMVYEGGLRVYSTLDPKLQTAAEANVASALTELEARRPKLAAGQTRDPLQAALIAIDPQTGYVRALVGGRNFAESHFDRATQANRQPGSAFKPFVYAAALEAGYTEATVIDNLDKPLATLQGAYLPDDGHIEGNSIGVRDALRLSSNRAAIQVMDQVGIDRVVRYARAFGLDRLPAVPSLALGAGEVTLASLTSAYAAFANGGFVRKPTLIRHVDYGDGEGLMTWEDAPSRAINETTAFLMSDMLSDVINSGTGAQARSLGFRLPAAGKTGTTNNFNDAWFIGYTPTLVVGVWIGYDMPHTIFHNGFAATVAVPLWAKFMIEATRGDKPAWFRAPDTLVTAEICPVSGRLATTSCTEHRRHYFVSGTEPLEYCDVHQPSLFKRIFGLANVKPAEPPPIDLAPAPVPAAPVETITDSGKKKKEPEAPVKKRGFWSRIFGGGSGKYVE
jgi:1A family penicillin-binding protein